ncbi:MAG TPA: protocatechuate 3,4-dioxygenase subunit alpha [Candidatus Sulfotelmatobacter sp.]|nr:protocatechuate 3,4-dioxygenase subunit alpha [Candidatus Sulfotelmatobacter sp.]
MSRQATTSQTVGPFFSIGMCTAIHDNLVSASTAGERVTIEGRVLDGDGIPVPDAILEIWQANSYGKYAHPEDQQDKPVEASFAGYVRIPTNDEGRFRFTTIKPGQVPDLEGKLQAPHIAVSVFARGLLRRLVTRIYFPDEPANAADFALNLVEPSRRETLIAKKAAGASGALKWDVILQGPNETVFFDCGL